MTMGMIQTRSLPAPSCFYCGRRIGYNQRAKAVRQGRAVLGFRHERCTRFPMEEKAHADAT